MKHQLIPLVASFISILPAVSLAQFTSGDDFNDPARDVSKWGTEDDTSPGASLQEISGRLHFLADSPSAFGSFASRIWRNPAPTYAADWQAGLDVALGSLEMLEGEYVLTGLTAGNAADPGAVIRLGLFRAQLDILESISGVSVEKRGPGGSEAGGFEEISGIKSAALRMSYDSNSRMLHAGVANRDGSIRTLGGWYTPLWGMNDSSRFELRVGAYSVGALIGSGQITADNFAISQQLPRAVGTLEGGDNFDDNSRNTTSWGRHDALLGSGALDETGGVLRYSTIGASGLLNDFAARHWAPGAGTMSQPWTAQVDVSLPDLSLQEGQETEVGLIVMSLTDPGDRVSLTLNLTAEEQGLVRRFRGAIERDGQAGFPELNLSARAPSATAALRLRWDPAAVLLRLEYDADGAAGGYVWNSLGSYALNAGDSSWELNSGSRFQIGVLGRSVLGAEVAQASNVRLDNFKLSGGATPVAPVKIVNVSKSGSKVSIKWDGGVGPFIVQRRGEVRSGTWTDLGPASNVRTFLADPAGARGFLRILDMGQ